MLLFALLLAQASLPPVPPRMATDDEITALACTFESALRGERCVYEGRPAPGDPRDNSAAVLDAALPQCAPQAMGDADLRKDCESAVAEAGHSTKCARRVRLADATGHLTPDAAACVDAVSEALRRARTAANISRECCACVAESACKVGPAQCKREVSELKPGAALSACLARSTCAACGFVMPAEKPTPPPAQETVASDADKT